MKATYFLGNQTFEVREEPVPKAKPGTVVVRNYACGVCGTDVHIYHGEPGSAEVHPPVVLGHEYAGVVAEVGEGVTGLQVGDHVTIDPNIYCGVCDACRNGKKQMCSHMEAVGVTMNGGFAEYSIVPAAQALRLNPQKGGRRVIFKPRGLLAGACTVGRAWLLLHGKGYAWKTSVSRSRRILYPGAECHGSGSVSDAADGRRRGRADS